MSGWMVVQPEADPLRRMHVVPEKGGHPDPLHEPSSDCLCNPRVVAETDLVGVRREIIVHAGPN